jgi:hypothetical protein
MKRPVRFTLFLVLIGLGLFLGFYSWNRPQANANRYQMLSTWGLGQYLAQHFPGSRVLLVSNPFVAQKKTSPSTTAQENSRIEGLLKGLNPRIQACEVVYPKLKAGALENPLALLQESGPGTLTTTPLSLLVASNAFDDLIEANPKTDLVVSLVGMPADLTASRAWQRQEVPRFAFLFPDFRFLGDTTAVRQAVSSGKLAAFVLIKPGADLDAQRVGKLGRKEFEGRFLLVHEENLGEIMQKWPRLFEGGK